MKRSTQTLALGLALVALCAGCATAEKATMVAEDAVARAAAASYSALNQYDEQKVNALMQKAQGGDVDGAMADAAAYSTKRQKAIKSLDAASSLLDAVDQVRSGAGAAKADPKALLDYLPKFAAALGDIAAALADCGVKLPDALTSALGALGVK